MPTVKLDDSGVSFDCAPGDPILRSALRHGIGFPYECGVGACGTCKFELLSGAVDSLWADATGLSERDRKKGRHLGCQAIALETCSVKVRLDDYCRPEIAPVRRKVVFAGYRDITHDIREITFVSRDRADFLPGQFALLTLPEVEGDRAYSMANLANERGEWKFQVRRRPNGVATTLLFDKLLPGQEIFLDGPYGMAYLRTDSPRDIVCISGGSGIAPMLSIAQGKARDERLAEKSLHFFFGGRTPADICGEDVLRDLPGYGSRLHYYAAISDADAAHGWPGPVGPVHELVASKLKEALAAYEFYLAGPPPMIQAVQNLLVTGHRVPPTQIHFDRFF